MAIRRTILDYDYERDDEQSTSSPAVPDFGGPVQMPTQQPTATTPATQGPAFDASGSAEYWSSLWGQSPDSLRAFRTAGDNARHYEDQTDANVLADPRYAHFVKTGEYQPSSQPYADAEWGAANFGGRTTPSGSTSGGSGFQPNFDSPGAALLERYAMDRFGQRTNPDPNSGTARFEAYLRSLQESLQAPSRFESAVPGEVDRLNGPVYSDQQTSQLKARVYDDLEVQRQQTKQRWLQEISRRGFEPSSGVALEGLLKIDEQFGQMRTVADREFAVNAIGLTEQRRAQAMELLQALAGAERSRRSETGGAFSDLMESEESRLRDAGVYASMPLELEDRAFGLNERAVGAAGNPSTSLMNALSLYNTLARDRQIDQARRDASLEAIFETIAGLDF